MIADGWDAERATEHLADLREQKARAEDIRDAFIGAAEKHANEARWLGKQIAHCEDMFSKPRVTPGGLT